MTSERTDPEVHAICGSNSGYQRHLKRDEEPCRPCRDAHNVYWAAYIADHPEQAESNKRVARLYSRARARAHKRLAEEFPEVYREFLAEERAKIAAEEHAKAGGDSP